MELPQSSSWNGSHHSHFHSRPQLLALNQIFFKIQSLLSSNNLNFYFVFNFYFNDKSNILNDTIILIFLINFNFNFNRKSNIL